MCWGQENGGSCARPAVLGALFGFFTVSDYVAVSQFHQVPRFSYEKSYGEDRIEHKTLFYTVIQKYPGTARESIEIENSLGVMEEREQKASDFSSL